MTKLTKQFLEKIFKETVVEFSNKIIDVNNVSIKYISRESFMADVYGSLVGKILIGGGLPRDIDKEYPGFAVVMPADKALFNIALDGTYKISICFEKAEEILKPFTTQQIREYLTHVFAHELCHIKELDIVEAQPMLWNSALMQSKGIQHLAYELLAEDIADSIADTVAYHKVEDIVWRVLMVKLNNAAKGEV